MCTIMKRFHGKCLKKLKNLFLGVNAMRGPKPTATVNNVYPGSDPEQGYSSTLNTS